MKCYLWIAVTTLVLASSIRGSIFHPMAEVSGTYLDKGANAVWAGVEWVNQPHSRDGIAGLANEFNQKGIKYIYVFVSYMRSDGSFAPSFIYAREFLAALKETQPTLQVLAWLGIPLANADWGYVDLGDAAVRFKISAFSSYLVNQIGFDGIHLDPEPVINGDSGVLLLMSEIRQNLNSSAILSIATRRIWPILPQLPWPMVGRFAWLSGYYREIAAHADQLVVMTYDSGLPLPFLYRQWVRFQVIEIVHAVKDTGTSLLIGIPASEERTLTHRPYAENILSGLQGVMDGLNDLSGYSSFVDGVAIYPLWEMDSAKWEMYKSLRMSPR